MSMLRSLAVAACFAFVVLPATAEAHDVEESGETEEDAGPRPPRVPRSSKFTFIAPSPRPADLVVTFDSRFVPIDQLDRNFSIEPGVHRVEAQATINGRKVAYDEEITTVDGKLTTIRIVLLPTEKFHACGDPETNVCLRAARSSSDVEACLEEGRHRREKWQTGGGRCGSCAVGAQPRSTEGVALALFALATFATRRRWSAGDRMRRLFQPRHVTAPRRRHPPAGRRA
jgi:hypothetical protein